MFLDSSVSQYSLVGGPFCISLSRMALLLQKHTLFPAEMSFIDLKLRGSGGKVEEKLSITVFVENKRTV